jgi:hypothetical protein
VKKKLKIFLEIKPADPPTPAIIPLIFLVKFKK